MYEVIGYWDNCRAERVAMGETRSLAKSMAPELLLRQGVRMVTRLARMGRDNGIPTPAQAWIDAGRPVGREMTCAEANAQYLAERKSLEVSQ